MATTETDRLPGGMQRTIGEFDPNADVDELRQARDKVLKDMPDAAAVACALAVYPMDDPKDVLSPSSILILQFVWFDEEDKDEHGQPKETRRQHVVITRDAAADILRDLGRCLAQADTMASVSRTMMDAAEKDGLDNREAVAMAVKHTQDVAATWVDLVGPRYATPEDLFLQSLEHARTHMEQLAEEMAPRGAN